VPPPPEPPASFLDKDGFAVLCEIEPSRRPDVLRVRDQIDALRPVADAYLIPDSHLGRATVSSVAVAHEVAYMGGLGIACLNARDRNVVGFKRDLLTAAAYGVDHFLFVYGDAPKEGRRAEDLTVRGMIDHVHSYGMGPDFDGYKQFKVGTVAKVGRELTWRSRADFVFVQIAYDFDKLVRWREGLDYSGRVYAAVLVLASRRMAERINAMLPDVRIPRRIVDKLDDPSVGIDLACEQIARIEGSGAFDGIHLIPVGRYREMAERLSKGSPG
jgi:5,10-methylenetetrahydrofolate reductase